MAGRGAKPKGKEHFLEFAEIYVSNGNNVAAAMREANFDSSNSTRFMKQQGVKEAIAYVRANIGEYKGCSLEAVIDIINEANRELDVIDAGNMQDACRRAETRLKCAKQLTDLMGYNAPVRTEHARLDSSVKDLDEIVKNAELNGNSADVREIEAEVIEEEAEEVDPENE